jgi:hypothetical protein
LDGWPTGVQRWQVAALLAGRRAIQRPHDDRELAVVDRLYTAVVVTTMFLVGIAALIVTLVRAAEHEEED